MPLNDDKGAPIVSNPSQAFERWIRGAFVAMNSELENLYFAEADRANVEGVGAAIKAALRDEGHAHVIELWHEGNTGDGFESGFSVLGNVGMYLAALRRHELTNPAREQRSPFVEASSLAMHVGASIGMAPRFATAHLSTHNKAIEGVRKSFTNLADEFLFIDENTRGILCFQRAAEELRRSVKLGVSNPVSEHSFKAAADALNDAIAVNERLFANLNVDRFFYSVRPYYKPYRVGRSEYRGANAGDFSGINEIDLLLGLCQASDPYYAQLLVDKMQFMVPDDQQRLRECMRYRSLLDEFLLLVERHSASEWFRRNGAAFLRVCDLYAKTARQHHDQLVSRFIALPAKALDEKHLAAITASGPPLEILLRSLETLRDYRTAARRSDLDTRCDDLARLRVAFG